MKREIDNEARNKRLDELSMKSFELDDICHEIWFTLMAYKRLRFNELHRALKVFGTDISKPTLNEHLKHLIKQKLVRRKREEAQKVSYGLTDEIKSLMKTPKEDMQRWLEIFKNAEKMGSKRFDAEEYYRRLTDTQLDRSIDNALNDVLASNLFELKNLINFDLKINKKRSDANYWKFVANPIRRLQERIIAENCRKSERYKKRLFEKMEILLKELRGDEEL